MKESTSMSRNVLEGKTVLVFGVSGVGKTTACEDFIRKHPEYRYLSASSVLKELKHLDTEKLRTASEHAIVQNQYALGRELRCRLKEIGSSPVLIDLHGIINNDELFVEVPVEVISGLEPDLLVLLEAPTSVVFERRASDPDRVRPLLSLDRLFNEQMRERSVVKAYANALSIPLLIGEVKPNFSLDSLDFW